MEFFENILGLKATFYQGEDLYEVKTEQINFYLRENEEFKVVFDFRVKNKEDAKKE